MKDTDFPIRSERGRMNYIREAVHNTTKQIITTLFPSWWIPMYRLSRLTFQFLQFESKPKRRHHDSIKHRKNLGRF
jgi:hypothetical protein